MWGVTVVWCGTVVCGVLSTTGLHSLYSTRGDNGLTTRHPRGFFFPSSLCASVVSQDIWTLRRSGFTHILAVCFSSLTVVVYCTLVFPFFEHFWSIFGAFLSFHVHSYCSGPKRRPKPNLDKAGEGADTVRRIKAVYSILSGLRHHHSNCDTIAKNQASPSITVPTRPGKKDRLKS